MKTIALGAFAATLLASAASAAPLSATQIGSAEVSNVDQVRLGQAARVVGAGVGRQRDDEPVDRLDWEGAWRPPRSAERAGCGPVVDPQRH